MGGIDAGFINGSGFFEGGGGLFVFALAGVDGPQRFEGLGKIGIVGVQDSGPHSHGFLGQRLGLGIAASVAEKKRQIVRTLGVIVRVGSQLLAAKIETLTEKCLAVLQVARIVVEKAEAV